MLLAREGRRVSSVCYLRAPPPEEGGGSRLNMAFSVRPGEPVAETSRLWLGLALEEMERDGLGELVVKCSDPEQGSFLLGAGFAAGESEGASVLDLATVDWEMVGSWAAGVEAGAPGVGLEFHGDRLSEEVLEEYVRGTADMAEAWGSRPEEARPVLEAMLGEEGRHYAVLARDASGKLLGATDAVWRPDHPEEVQQRFTGVRPEHRGRGIGKALKAAMLLRLRERCPGVRRVATSNDVTNASMLSINDRLGFRRMLVTVALWIDRESLAKGMRPARGGHRAAAEGDRAVP